MSPAFEARQGRSLFPRLAERRWVPLPVTKGYGEHPREIERAIRLATASSTATVRESAKRSALEYPATITIGLSDN